MKVVKTSRLAEAIGVTRSRVYQLRKAGILGTLTYMDGSRVRNRWDLWNSVGSYARFKEASWHPGRPSVGERDDAEAQSIFDFV
jgi:hypothetical protein